VFTSKDFASRIRGGYTAYKVRTSVDKVQSVVDRLDVLIALTPGPSRRTSTSSTRGR